MENTGGKQEKYLRIRRKTMENMRKHHEKR